MTEEQQLLEMIAMIQRDYQKQIQPYVDRLVLLRSLLPQHPGFCWTFGSEGRDDAMEQLRQNAHLAPGLWFAGARLYVQARKLRAAEQ